MTELKSLQNHFLVAMPSLDDPYFSRSLIYVCEHNAEGAMGIVVNQPSTMNVKQLLEQTDKELTVSDDKAEQIVLAGGPVNQERGFVLHSSQKTWASSLKLAPGIMVTTSKDILTAIASDEGPGGKALTDAQISVAYNCSARTVENTRRRFVEEGFDLALNGKPRPVNRKSKIDGRVQSQLIALRCSDPPAGHNKWSLQLLGDKLVELQLVESISRQGVADALKKLPSNPGELSLG